jgi:hypothetical protein
MEAGKVNEVIELFNRQANEASCLTFVARDRGLQEACLAQMRHVEEVINAARSEAVSEGDERAANFLLGLQCVAQALASELRVYLLLKDERPEEAWDALIDTQDALAGAMCAGPDFAHLEQAARRVRDLEQYLFPPQMFLSAGMIVRKQVCSICGGDYSECDHIAGMPYCGQFCGVRLTEIEADHVAIVEEPANRRCRVTSFSVPGGTRNRMTWVVTPGDPKVPPNGIRPEDAMLVEGILDTVRDDGTDQSRSSSE